MPNSNCRVTLRSTTPFFTLYVPKKYGRAMYTVCFCSMFALCVLFASLFGWAYAKQNLMSDPDDPSRPWSKISPWAEKIVPSHLKHMYETFTHYELGVHQTTYCEKMNKNPMHTKEKFILSYESSAELYSENIIHHTQTVATNGIFSVCVGLLWFWRCCAETHLPFAVL